MRRLTRPQNHSLDPSRWGLYRAAGEKDSRRPQRSCPPCRPRVPTPSRVSEAGSGTAVGAAGSVGRDGSTSLAAVPVTPGRPLALKPAGHVHRAGGDRHPNCAGVARVCGRLPCRWPRPPAEGNCPRDTERRSRHARPGCPHRPRPRRRQRRAGLGPGPGHRQEGRRASSPTTGTGRPRSNSPSRCKPPMRRWRGWPWS